MIGTGLTGALSGGRLSHMTVPAVPDGPGSVWSRFPLDPRSSGDLRAADRDRETAREIIAEAYADGQLEHNEYSQRLDGVLGAHHLGQLVPLLSDLTLQTRQASPSSLPRLPQPPAAAAPWLKHPIVRTAGFVIVVTNLVWVWTSISSGRLLYYWPMWPALGMIITVVAAVTFGRPNPDRRRERREERDRRRELE